MGVNAAGLSDGEHSDTLAAYSSACAFFGERLSAVTGSDWDRPTPCDDWDVQTLVAHVVTGEALVARLLREGGSWDTEDVDHMLSSSRNYAEPFRRIWYYGFRCVLTND